MEILSPAGSYDIFKAVISAGADAVYLGGNMFGARAYAGNFDKEELIRAIDYAHIRDKKVYLTVNTLLKKRELEHMLIDYLAPYYEAGLDAVIVQDMGVFKTIKECFPDISIHASTQMTITGTKGAQILKEMGASRIVTARELSLEEIKDINDNCDIEIESFVHGALCYCYSGQCLLSSMNGSRSGNRGRCAQPCRLAYDVVDTDGRRINTKDSLYSLSPKDMCALSILPQIQDAGVYSLKIEGRMKNVSYAAGVTAMYRKYLDMLQLDGKEKYKVSDADINELMDMYNRGAFTTGYYNNSKGKSMMSLTRPNHMGTKALEVVSNNGGNVTFKALSDINKQDVFEIDKDNSFTSGEAVSKGGKLSVNLPKKYKLTKGRILYRTRNGHIVSQVNTNYVENELKTPVKLNLFVCINEPLKLMITTDFKAGSDNFMTVVSGGIVSEAKNHPATKEQLTGQISRLGNTEFVAVSAEAEVVGQAFVPVGELNELRRNAIERLRAEISDSYRRNWTYTCNSICADNIKDSHSQPRKSLLVNCVENYKKALSYEDCELIYVDYKIADLVDYNEALSKSIVPVLALPHVLRGKHNDRLKALLEKALSKDVNSFLVRNLEELGVISEVVSQNEKNTAKIILDANMYVWNNAAVLQYKEICDNLDIELIRVTMPYELKKDELANLSTGDVEREIIVKSRIPLMVSEQCVKRTYGLCDAGNGSVYLRDSKGKSIRVDSCCEYCYSVMYSSVYDISKEKFNEVNADFVRVELIDNDYKDENVFDGHFNLGVE